MYLHHWIENTAWWLDAATCHLLPAAQAIASPPSLTAISRKATPNPWSRSHLPPVVWTRRNGLRRMGQNKQKERQKRPFSAIFPVKTRVFVYPFVTWENYPTYTYGMICGQFNSPKKCEFWGGWGGGCDFCRTSSLHRALSEVNNRRVCRRSSVLLCSKMR
jgi:hypothetical protein